MQARETDIQSTSFLDCRTDLASYPVWQERFPREAVGYRSAAT
jgi:hypothetical protein